MKFLFFDTETTGLPRDRRISAEKQKDNWPDMVSISWIIVEDETMISCESYIVRPDEWNIPQESTDIHGISHAFAKRNGHSITEVVERFAYDVEKCDYIIAHNLEFDKNVVDNACQWRILEGPDRINWRKKICTAEYGKEITRIIAQNGRGRFFRYPKLSELYQFVMKKQPSLTLHNSLNDTMLLAELFFHLPIYKSIIGKGPNESLPNLAQDRLQLDLSSAT